MKHQTLEVYFWWKVKLMFQKHYTTGTIDHISQLLLPLLLNFTAQTQKRKNLIDNLHKAAPSRLETRSQKCSRMCGHVCAYVVLQEQRALTNMISNHRFLHLKFVLLVKQQISY
jgi:hypothetical protein